MEKISEEILFNLLRCGKTIKNREINCEEINLENILLAEFDNCEFTSPRTHFTKNSTYENETTTPKINISFKSCSFNNLLIRKINNFGNVRFFHIKMATSILIHHSNCESFDFEDSDNINCRIEILHCNFQKRFAFINNTFIKNGKFQLHENTYYKPTVIINNTFNGLNFTKQYFKDFLIFENKFIKNSVSSINESEFEKVKFSKSNFSNLTLHNCNFLSTTWFEECKNLDNSELKFVACAFKKYVLFDNSSIHSFEISHSFFERKVSFDSFETNKMKLHQVAFEKVAYFDNLNKSNEKGIEEWDRKTLRAIKRELTNSHNQIDYLRFKAYELNAYKKEVDQNKLNWKDSLILYFNQDSNYFGLDWTKGISFIFQWSFVFYLLYIISYSARIYDINCVPKIEDFLVIYLKFTNPFSFLKPPLEDTENYFLPFLFFLLGKVLVSYGIYQTIQAFRKFGVNGG